MELADELERLRYGGRAQCASDQAMLQFFILLILHIALLRFAL